MNLWFATTIVRRIADFHTVLFAWLSLTWDSCVADWYKLRLHVIWPVWVVTESSVVSQGHWLYVKLVSRTCNAPSLAEWNKWIREQANCCAVRCASSKRNPFSPENNIIIQRKTCRFTISLAAFISIKYPLSLWNCCRSQRLKTGVMFENSSRLSECIYIRNLGLCWKVATMRQGGLLRKFNGSSSRTRAYPLICKSFTGTTTHSDEHRPSLSFTNGHDKRKIECAHCTMSTHSVWHIFGNRRENMMLPAMQTLPGHSPYCCSAIERASSIHFLFY